MLFDHGCDMVTTFAFIGLVMTLTRGGLRNDGFQMAIMTYTLFHGAFFCLMESFFVGGLMLEPFNGPTEGNLLISLMGPITYFFGNKFFIKLSF